MVLVLQLAHDKTIRLVIRLHTYGTMDCILSFLNSSEFALVCEI